jgi:hypothetical protein
MSEELYHSEHSTEVLDIVTDLISALPGNTPVNTVQHETIDEAVFPMSSAIRPVLITSQ